MLQARLSNGIDKFFTFYSGFFFLDIPGNPNFLYFRNDVLLETLLIAQILGGGGLGSLNGRGGGQGV